MKIIRLGKNLFIYITLLNSFRKHVVFAWFGNIWLININTLHAEFLKWKNPSLFFLELSIII